MAELVTTLMEAGKLAEAESVVDEAQRVAATADDECVQARLLVEQHWLKVHRATRGTTQAIPVVVEQVIPIFEQARDDRGLSRTWQLNASANWWHGHISAATEAWERAAAHARAAGSEHEWALMLTWIASSTWTGATPVEVGIRRIEEIREAVRGHPGCEAEVLRPLGGLHGFAGRFELARSLFAIRAAALDELGRGLNYAARQTEPFVEMLAGDFATAERQLREGYDALEAMGENAVRSTTSALLARAVLAQGRHDEAERFTKVAEELGEPVDLLTQIVWRGVRARVAAGRGNVDEGERLAREAVAAAGETDFVNFRADALLDLATVLDTAGRTGETRSLIEEAVRLYEAKGNTVSAQTARARISAAV